MAPRETSTAGNNIDPATAWLAGLMASGPNDRTFTEQDDMDEPGGIGRNDDSVSDDEQNNDDIPEPEPSGMVFASSVSTVKEVCRQLKRRKTLKPESEADLDVFAACTRPEEHATLIYVGILEVRDLLKTVRKDESWTIPEALSDNLRIYATAFLLCPTISTYRGKLANKLIDALRELAIAQLPPVKETAQVKLVHTRIGNYLTTAHNVLKTQLKASVDDPVNKGNIAHLANVVIGKTGFKPTVQLYMRLAFLRFHMISYPTLSPEEWWLQVDKTLISLRKELKTETAISAAFTEKYNEDKAQFGDPLDSGRTTAEIRELDTWQVVLQTHAKSVEPAAAAKKRKEVPS